MKRLWLVGNMHSGSTKAAVVAELEAACADYLVVGRTDFPADSLPDPAALSAAGADTLVVFAGDGTINAATTAADAWDGVCLVLPGGTMNGLAKALHGPAAWRDILARAAAAPTRQVPVAACGDHRGLVGVILGPAASWFHAREAVRHGAWSRVGRALRFAARKTFARTVRVVGDADHAGRHRAVIVTPQDDGLEIASIDTPSWLAAARFGVAWLAGSWRNEAGVTLSVAPAVTLTSARRITALFDGEAANLPSPAAVVHGTTRLRFIATKPA